MGNWTRVTVEGMVRSIWTGCISKVQQMTANEFDVGYMRK